MLVLDDFEKFKTTRLNSLQWYNIHGVGAVAVGWDTALQPGRSRVRFPIVLLEISLV